MKIKAKLSEFYSVSFGQIGVAIISLLLVKVVTEYLTPSEFGEVALAMTIVALEKDPFCIEAAQKLNDTPSQICTQIERDFLRTLEGGCTAPIGALAKIEGETIEFKGCLLSLDGTKKIAIEKTISLNLAAKAGDAFAKEVLQKGGDVLLKEIKAAVNL